jgi:hypothetical protein
VNLEHACLFNSTALAEFTCQVANTRMLAFDPACLQSLAREASTDKLRHSIRRTAIRGVGHDPKVEFTGAAGFSGTGIRLFVFSYFYFARSFPSSAEPGVDRNCGNSSLISNQEHLDSVLKCARGRNTSSVLSVAAIKLIIPEDA